jgi:hypothetical protein
MTKPKFKIGDIVNIKQNWYYDGSGPTGMSGATGATGANGATGMPGQYLPKNLRPKTNQQRNKFYNKQTKR